MIIQNSNLQLTSRHQQILLHEIEESRVEGYVRPGQAFHPDNLIDPSNPEAFGHQDAVRISPIGLKQSPAEPDAATAGDPLVLDPLNEMRRQLLERLLEALTGKKVRLASPEALLQRLRSSNLASSQETPPPDDSMESTAPEYGLHYQYHETRLEEEHTSFTAQGTVLTADGETLAIDLELNMNRSFRERVDVEVRLGAAAKDPLVVNFQGPGAQLTERRFAFDLDLDGAPDTIAVTQPGSGFLALDHNSNGTVEDGRELFGPQTGDGFSELAAYDADGNSFIDAGDPVFDRLRIWTHSADGGAQLLALNEVGIGALYLGHVATPFEVRDGDNQPLGTVRTTGLFMREDGSTGTVQQIDLVI